MSQYKPHYHSTSGTSSVEIISKSVPLSFESTIPRSPPHAGPEGCLKPPPPPPPSPPTPHLTAANSILCQTYVLVLLLLLLVISLLVGPTIALVVPTDTLGPLSALSSYLSHLHCLFLSISPLLCPQSPTSANSCWPPDLTDTLPPQNTLLTSL